MRNYTITLKVLTPVFIGSGNTISKKDFVLEGNYAKIYDPFGLYTNLGKQYENFLYDNNCLTDHISYYRKNIESALKYKISTGDTKIRKRDGIAEFMRDPYGCPYIPGSSLKGALRTALLSTIVMESSKANDRFRQFRREIKTRSPNAKEIEKIAFGEFNECKFRYIRISDSKPLSTKDLILSKKVDFFKDGNSNSPNICREALKPGTKVEFSLTIDDTNPERNKIWTKDQILVAIKNFSRQYKREYLSKFSTYDGGRFGDDIIYLGGGTGFLTKTVNQSLFGKNTVNLVADYLNLKFPRHHHFKDKRIGVSPRAKKCTRINKEIVEMGICRIRIEEK